MNDYVFDNRTLARHGTARSLTDTAKYIIIPPMKLPVCYSSARYVRVATISCSMIGRFQCARDGA